MRSNDSFSNKKKAIAKQIDLILEGFMGGSAASNPLVPSSQKALAAPEERTPEITVSAEDQSALDGLTGLDSEQSSTEDNLNAVSRVLRKKSVESDLESPQTTAGEDDLLRQVGLTIVNKLAKLGKK